MGLLLRVLDCKWDFYCELMGLLLRVLDCKWDFYCELMGLLLRTVETVDNFLNRTFISKLKNH